MTCCAQDIKGLKNVNEDFKTVLMQLRQQPAKDMRKRCADTDTPPRYMDSGV